MRLVLTLGCALAGSCGAGAAPDRAPAPAVAPAIATDAAVVAVVVDAGAAAVPADCAAPLRRLAGLVDRMHHAKAPQAPRAAAIAAWQAIARPCQRGAWYLAAAQLERWSRADLVAGTVTLAGADQALIAGLAAGDDRGVLVLTAFAAGLGGKPALPRDACARATAIASDQPEAADQLAYVCGHAALAAGDAATAATLLATIAAPTRFPDLALRRAQAEARRGDRPRARALAAQAARLDEVSARGFGVTARELATLRAAAEVIE